MVDWVSFLVVGIIAAFSFEAVTALSQFHSNPTRRDVLRSTVASAFFLGQPVFAGSANAAVESPDIASSGAAPLKQERSTSITKKLDLSDEQLKSIITSDVVDRQFLATADLTPDIYDSSRATFTDEIDTYTMEKWIQGTKKLFVGENSSVRLVGDVHVSPEQADFRFDEDLQFNIPFRPVVHLTGQVILKRDLDTGLITSYQEIWDQGVTDVLKTAKF